MSVEIRMGHHLWMSWLQIGGERERAAAQARAHGLELRTAGEDVADALSEEMHASMVGIAAGACAIDALYGEIKSLVPVPPAVVAKWEHNGTPRHRRIFETLKHCCRLGRRTNLWPRQFDDLYLLRDPVIHHEIKHRPVAPHPIGQLNVSQETADYCLENTRESLDLAFDVVLTAMRQPKAPALVAWAQTMPDVPAAAEGFREYGRPGPEWIRPSHTPRAASANG